MVSWFLGSQRLLLRHVSRGNQIQSKSGVQLQSGTAKEPNLWHKMNQLQVQKETLFEAWS